MQFLLDPVATVSLPFHSLRPWLLLQCAVWIPVLAAVAVRPDAARAWPLAGCAGVVAISFAALWRTLRAREVADRVTGARVVATCIAACVVAISDAVTWLAFGVLALAAFADILDGWIARRRGPTDAGALLDMEADQLFVLLASIVVVVQDRVGPWILLLPAYRYVYAGVLTALGLPAHDPRPRGDNRRGRLVCGLTVAALLIALAPSVPEGPRSVAGLVAVVALGWSFGSDALHLILSREHKSEPA